MTRTATRTLGKVGIVTAAAAAALLASSGTASAAVLSVVAVPTPSVESISTLVSVLPNVVSLGFARDVDCTVTATEVLDEDNTAIASGTLPVPPLLPISPVIGTIVIDDLEAGIYTVSVTCDDGGTPVTSPVGVPVTVLPSDIIPPIDPPIDPPIGGGSSPFDLFES